MKGWFAFSVMGLLVLPWTTTVRAVEIKEININGFLSQGYLKSTENNYFSDTMDGTWNFSELGLSFIVPLEEGLYFGMQFFTHRLAGDGTDVPTIDWAFLDYSYENWLGIRGGKVRMPFGLYNKQRDVDSLRTSVLLPQTVYMEGLRDFLVAIHGFELYGNLDLKKAGYLDYEIFVGGLDVSAQSDFVENAFGVMRIVFAGENLDLDGVLRAQGVRVEDLEVAVKRLGGYRVIWSPIADLRLGYSRMWGLMSVSLGGLFDAELKVTELSAGSFEFDKGSLTLVYEYMRFGSDAFPGTLPGNKFELEGWYGGFSWQMTDALSSGFSYGEYFPMGGENRKDFFVTHGLPDYLAWQKESTYSIAYQLTEKWQVKAEVKNIHGAGLSLAFETEIVPTNSWRLYAVKTSIVF